MVPVVVPFQGISQQFSHRDKAAVAIGGDELDVHAPRSMLKILAPREMYVRCNNRRCTAGIPRVCKKNSIVIEPGEGGATSGSRTNEMSRRKNSN